MSVCPTLETLKELLRDGLLMDSASTVREHVEGCSSCLDVLDRLTDDDELDNWMSDGLSDARAESARRAALHGLRTSRSELPALVEQGSCRSIATLGGFDLEAEIGRGGMGVVFRARDRATGRVVALKVLHGSMANDRNRRRFIQEVRAAASVEHDNVVRLYSMCDPADGVPYFVMEFIDGPTLADEVRLHKRLEPRVAAKWIAQAADGLSAAHAAGLVHRDIKPSNILIDPATGRAKIGDFGLARNSTEVSDLTREGELAGTPAYLSPEQARGETEAGVLADVYALGVTLYECFAGEPPFRGAPHRVIKQILNDEPRSPRELNDAVPRDLETICLKAMSKSANHRYGSAREFADDLRRWLGGEPIRARAIGPLGRFGRLCGRHPKITILASALVLAMVAGGAGVLWQWRNAEANALQARQYLHRTLRSVDVFFTKVSENSLLDVPSLQPLRKELLEEARSAYESLLRERPNDPRIRAEMARAGARLARVIYAIESSEKGIALLQQAVSNLDQVIRESPSDLAARHDLIECLSLTAKSLVNSSRFDEAQAYYQRVLAECEGIRRLHGDSLEAQVGVEATHAGLGRIALHTRRISDGVVYLEQSLRENRELLKRKPDEPRYLQNLTNTSIDLFYAYQALGRRDESKASFDEGFQAAKRLIAEYPKSLEYRSRLAAYFISRAEWLLTDSITLQGAKAFEVLDEARRTCAEGIALQRELVQANPSVDTYRPDLIELLSVNGNVAYFAGKQSEAITSFEEALAVHSILSKGALKYAAARVVQVNTLVSLGNVLSDVGRFPEGLQKLSDAESVLMASSDAERKSFGDADMQLYICRITRAILLKDAGQTSDSMIALDEAIKIAPKEIRTIVELMRDQARAECLIGPAPDAGRALRLAPLVEAISRSAPLSACGNITFAKIFALASQAAPDIASKEALEKSAVLRIRKASETGYLGSKANRERLAAIPVFESLRARGDFRAMLEAAKAQSTNH